MSTRAAQIELLLGPLTDPTTGSLCSGYTAYFYAAGTSTPKNVWTEKEKTNQFTSYELDSGGKILLYGDGVYKIIVKNPDGTAVLTLDNIKVKANNFSTVQKTSAYTATPDDDVILCTGTWTLDIEDVATFERPLLIKNIGSGTITLDPYSTQAIDADATKTLTLTNPLIEIVPDTISNVWRGFALAYMPGDANTILWMYLNTAPTGWTVLATGADTVLGVAGGSAAYNVNGGNPDSVATWTISGIAADAHTHTGPNHAHAAGSLTVNTYHRHDGNPDEDGGRFTLSGNRWTDYQGNAATAVAGSTDNSGTGATSAASATGVTHTPGWRPKASVGKLFQFNG